MNWSLSPSFAVALVLCIPVWIVAEILGELIPEGGKLPPKAVKNLRKLVPFLVALIVCFAGMGEQTAEWMGYEGMRWSSPLSFGINTGALAVVLHHFGIRPVMEGFFRGTIGRFVRRDP